MVKLWEKSEIAKIAIKRGAQNTNSDMMAEELKVGKFAGSFDLHKVALSSCLFSDA